jgi:hypothetical protein
VAETDTVYLPPGELTAVLGISDVEISRLARKGILPRIQNPEKPKYYLYPLLDLLQWVNSSSEVTRPEGKDDYWAARAKSEKERSHAIATTNALRDGKLLEARDVEATQRELAHTLKQRFAMIPGRVADVVDANGDRGRIEQVVTAEINAALAAL